MAYAWTIDPEWNYAPHDYGLVGLTFRGPPCDTARPHVAFFGGAETFGRQVENPFPSRFDASTGLAALNLATVGAGLQTYFSNPGLIELANRANALVWVLPGTTMVNNAFYTVHPRRNDRVLRATSLFNQRLPEFDFFDVHFIGHFLNVLSSDAPEFHATLVETLCQEWPDHIHRLCDRIKVPIHAVCIQGGQAAGLVEQVEHRFVSVSTVRPEDLHAQAADDLTRIFRKKGAP